MPSTPQSGAFTAMNTLKEQPTYRHNPRPSRYSSSDNAVLLSEILSQPQQNHPKYSCEDCDEHFSEYAELRDHIKSRVCAGDVDGVDIDDNNNSINVSSSGGGGGGKNLRGKVGRWLCNLCGKDYSSKGNLQRHQENIHEVADGEVDNAEIGSDGGVRVHMVRSGSPQSTGSLGSVRFSPGSEGRAKKRKRALSAATGGLGGGEDVDGGDGDGDDKSMEEEYEDARGEREDSVLLATPTPPPQRQPEESKDEADDDNDNNDENNDRGVKDGDTEMEGAAEGNTANVDGNGNVECSVDTTSAATVPQATDTSNAEGAASRARSEEDDQSITDIILNAHARAQKALVTSPSPDKGQQNSNGRAYQPITIEQQLYQLGKENRTLRLRLEQALKENVALKEDRRVMVGENKRLKLNNRNLLQMVNEYAKVVDGL